VPPDIPVDGIPVDGKFSPLDDPPDMGNDGLEFGVVRGIDEGIGSGFD
jgi:hypothetical protein